MEFLFLLEFEFEGIILFIKVYFEKHLCYYKFKARFLKTSYFFFAFEKDILRRICPIELKFSGLVALSRFCVISSELFHPVHFVKVMH